MGRAIIQLDVMPIKRYQYTVTQKPIGSYCLLSIAWRHDLFKIIIRFLILNFFGTCQVFLRSSFLPLISYDIKMALQTSDMIGSRNNKPTNIESKTFGSEPSQNY